MESLDGSKENDRVLESLRESIAHSYSFDGYERLHDEAMDKISVSIHYSDYEEAFNATSENNLTNFKTEKVEKKMKISLSQEQLKLNGNGKNLLSVPTRLRKPRSASFNNVENSEAVKFVKINPPTPSSSESVSTQILNTSGVNQIITLTPPKFTSSENYDEIIYAVPRKTELKVEALDEITSLRAASPSPSASVAQTSSAQLNTVFKYPLSFYCKICNNILNDPRTLDCLHSFCLQCLAKSDATSDLQNNQFWRKISDTSNIAHSISHSSVESDFTIRARSFISGSMKGRKLFKDKSPTRSVKGRHSSIISFSEKPKSIICKTCGLTTEMSIHGVYRLPPNTLLARKIRDVTGGTQEKSNSCRLCTFGIDATALCVTCDLNLCSSCRDIHKRHTSYHEFKNLDKKSKKCFDKSPAKKTSIKCQVHTQNDLKLFCTTCCQIICSECTILIHRGHKMTSTSKAAKLYIATLKEAKDNTKPLSVYAIHSISKLNEISKKINLKCDTVENEVENFLVEYFEALQVHRRTLLNQIERCRETKMDMIQCQQIDLERRSNEAKTAIAFTEELLKDGTEEENLMFVSLLLKKFESCRSSDRAMDIRITDSLQFLPEVKAPSNQAQNNIPLFGIITTQIAVGRNCSLESMQGLSNLRVNKKAEFILQTRDIEGRAMCHGSAEVEVTVSYRNVAFKTLPVNISDKRDGTYVIWFVPDSPGLMQISITVNGKSIQDSPFTVRARNLRPHAGIFHCCSFCSSNGKKVCACDGQMEIEGYRGCGHGHVGWPGRRHWSCCASILENSECSVANAIPTELIED